MANRIFNDVQQWSDDDGTPLNGGKITFYEPGTTTLKDTYTNSSLGTAHTNPVILDANGRPSSPIWLSGEYKYKVTTSADVAVGLTVDNLNISSRSVESGILLANGSFEIDTDSDGQPNDWTISALTSATIAIDTTDSAHGKNSLLFTSGGNGGGTATSARFDVLKGALISVYFTHKSSSATALTKVDVITYDKDDVVISTLSAYSEGAANPTSYSTENVSVTADATAVTAEVVVTGIDAASTTKTAGTTMNIDGMEIVVSSQNLLTKVIEIGAWNMDTLANLSIAHELSRADIRSVFVMILDDNSFSSGSGYSISYLDNGSFSVSNTNIDMDRVNAGLFDDAFFSTLSNRGYITIQYAG